jgi:hypothetical protein
MQVTKLQKRVTLFSWSEKKMKSTIDKYKASGFKLSYLKNELFATRIGPFTTWTAVMVNPKFETPKLVLVK